MTDATEAQVRTALGTANVTRVGGADRYDTAGMVADLGVTRGMYWDGVGIATGAAFPDALSGGAMLGRMNSVVLLTRPDVLSSSAGTRLTSNADTIGTVHFLGGTAAVTQAVRDEVAQLLQ